MRFHLTTCLVIIQLLSTAAFANPRSVHSRKSIPKNSTSSQRLPYCGAFPWVQTVQLANGQVINYVCPGSGGYGYPAATNHQMSPADRSSAYDWPHN